MTPPTPPKHSLGHTTQILHSTWMQNLPNGGVHPPIQPSVTYTYQKAEDLIAAFQGKIQGFTYARSSSPTISILEKRINALEKGADTLVTASGMAAIWLPLLALVRAGDHILASKYIFANSVSLFNTLKYAGIDVDCVDVTDIASVEAARQPQTRFLFLETISNPLTYIPDLENISAFARQHNILTIVDNTLTTPYLFTPKKLNFTFAHHSLSKYLGGHAAALGGSITELANHDWQSEPNILPLYKKSATSQTLATNSLAMKQIRKKGMRDMGCTLAPEQAATISLGLETFPLRMERICKSSEQIATMLDQHPKIAHVHYPSLPTHPHHHRMKKWYTGGAGIMAFTLKSPSKLLKFLNALALIRRATHLGDTRTLILPVAPTIFFEAGPEQRKYLGIDDGLIRLAVGIEEPADLLNDLNDALSQL